jgi:putative MATE family efflux protein
MVAKELHKEILSGPILLAVAHQLPANVVALGFQGFVGAMDVFFISYLGTDAIAAVTLVFPCLALMRTIAATALGTATSSLIAAAVGKDDLDAARRSVACGLLLTVIYGGCWAALFVGYGEHLFSYLGANSDQLKLAGGYSRVIFWGAPLTCAAQLCLGVLRGVGSASSATLIASIGGVVQLLATPLLMFGAFGSPPLGASGAALAFLASSLPMVAGSPYLIRRIMPGLLSWHTFMAPLDARLFVRFISTAGPATLNSTLNYFVLLVLSALVATLGSDSLAAFGIVTRIEYFGFLVAFGGGATTVTFVAMNFGAGQIPRARKAMWSIALITTAVICAAVLAIAINPRMISQLFSSDELVRKAADPYLRSGLVGFPFLTLGLIIYYASLAFSSPMLPFLINAVRCAILIAAVWLSIHFFDVGLFGVGLGVTLSSFAYLAVMLAWLGRSSIWNSTQSVAA